MSRHEAGGCCGGAASYYSLHMNEGEARIHVRDSPSVLQILTGSEVNVADGAWHSIVGTRDIASNTLNLFVDGQHFSTSLLATGSIHNQDGKSDSLTIGAKTFAGTTKFAWRFYIPGRLYRVRPVTEINRSNPLAFTR